MNCDAIQNRLLALPDLRRVPDELRGHLDECPACRAYLARAVRLDKLIAAVPVPPSSEETKAAFLDRATEAGPVIKRIPVVRRRDSATYLTGRRPVEVHLRRPGRRGAGRGRLARLPGETPRRIGTTTPPSRGTTS